MSRFNDLERERQRQEEEIANIIAEDAKVGKRLNKMVESVMKDFASSIWGANGGFFSAPKWSYSGDPADKWMITHAEFNNLWSNAAEAAGRDGLAQVMALPLTTSMHFTVMLVPGARQFLIFAGWLGLGGDFAGTKSTGISEAALVEALGELYRFLRERPRGTFESVPDGELKFVDRFIIKRADTVVTLFAIA